MQTKRTISHNDKGFRLATRLIALLYFFAAVCAATHQHTEMATPSAAAHTMPMHGTVLSDAPAEKQVVADRTCMVCDFIAHLISPAQTAHATLQATPLSPLPIFAPRPVPLFFPARFCDRSAARAPPVSDSARHPSAFPV